MAQSRILKLNILAETKDLVKGLGDAEKATSSTGDKIKKGFKVAAAAVVAAAAAIGAFAIKSIAAGEAAATANARISQINKSMGLFGGSVDEVNERLIAYAEATARATGIDQNSIKATQAKLLTFKDLAQSADEVNGSFDRATKAAIDLAAAGFGSAETNAAQLGKALQDPIKGLTALARSGVTFTEVEKERIKTLVESNQVGEAQRLVLEAIEKQVGGTAEATANASERIKVTFNLLTEQVGLILLPIFEKFANLLIDKVVPFIEAYLIPIVKQLTENFNKQLAPAFDNLWKFIKDKVLPVLVALGKFILFELIPVYRDILKPVIEEAINVFKRLFDRINLNRDSFIELGQTLDKVWFFIKNYLAPIIEFILIKKLQELEKALNFVITATKFVIDNFNIIVKLIPGLEQVLKLLNLAWNKSGAAAEYATEQTNRQNAAWFDSFSMVSGNVIPAVDDANSALGSYTSSLFSSIAATGSLTGANGKLADSKRTLADETKKLTALQRELAALQAGGAISTISKDQASFFRSELGLISEFGGFIEGINAKPGDPFYGFGRGSNVESAIAQRRGGSATATGGVTINIQGTVIDPEGAARAIEQLISDSNARGGAVFEDLFGINP
jgi:hypothetical protein